jgi:hypothetical protein
VKARWAYVEPAYGSVLGSDRASGLNCCISNKLRGQSGKELTPAGDFFGKKAISLRVRMPKPKPFQSLEMRGVRGVAARLLEQVAEQQDEDETGRNQPSPPSRGRLELALELLDGDGGRSMIRDP